MLFLDVNVCLEAYRPTSSPQAALVSDWLNARLSEPHRLGVSEQVLSSVIRIATHPRIFVDPSPAQDAIAFAEALVAAPATVVVRPGPRHWTHFRELVTTYDLRGNHVADAYLASLAMEHGATFVTRDRGFSRFAGLRTLDPLAE